MNILEHGDFHPAAEDSEDCASGLLQHTNLRQGEDFRHLSATGLWIHVLNDVLIIEFDDLRYLNTCIQSI